MATDRPTEAEVRELLEHFEHCREPNGGTVRRFGRALLEAWERGDVLERMLRRKDPTQWSNLDQEFANERARADAAEKRVAELEHVLWWYSREQNHVALESLGNCTAAEKDAGELARRALAAHPTPESED